MTGVPTDPLFRYSRASRWTKFLLLFCQPTYDWDERYRITFKRLRGKDYVTKVDNLGGTEDGKGVK